MAKFALSQTAQQLKRSIMRDLMPLATSPDILSMAGGLPATDCLPVARLQECLEAVLHRDGARALQYGPPYMPLRQWIAEYMRQKGVACQPENIFITNGAQQGLSILSRLFADPGDAAVIEAVTFTGVQQVATGRRLSIRTVPTNLDSGVDVDALDGALRALPRPKFAILIPNFHNPLGVTISLPKREQIAELAQQYNVPIIEDDPYSPLRFTGSPVPPLASLDRSSNIIYVGSFSKMLAPGVRMGWIVAPEALADRITVLRESIDLESSQLLQRAVSEFLQRGYLDESLRHLNRVNRERCSVLLTALQQELAPIDASWTVPKGGLFCWVTLPESIDAAEHFRAAVAQKVAYIPGNAFAVEGGYRNTLRLNFSNISAEHIREAVRRLASVLGSGPAT